MPIINQGAPAFNQQQATNWRYGSNSSSIQYQPNFAVNQNVSNLQTPISTPNPNPNININQNQIYINQQNVSRTGQQQQIKISVGSNNSIGSVKTLSPVPQSLPFGVPQQGNIQNSQNRQFASFQQPPQYSSFSRWNKWLVIKLIIFII